MHNSIIIALCFILTILILLRIKHREPKITTQPAEDSPRKGFTLPWISQAASTVKAIIIISTEKKTKWYEKCGLVCSIVVAGCAFVNLVLEYYEQIVSFFGRMFT